MIVFKTLAFSLVFENYLKICLSDFCEYRTIILPKNQKNQKNNEDFRCFWMPLSNDNHPFSQP
jgi:hypothetical protein